MTDPAHGPRGSRPPSAAPPPRQRPSQLARPAPPPASLAPTLVHLGGTGPALHIGAHTWTADALRARARAWATALALAGVGRGDAVLIATASRDADAVAASLGVWWLGATLVPVNPRATAAELAVPLADTAPVLALVDHDVAGRLPAAAPVARWSEAVAEVDRASPAPGDAPSPPAATPDDVALILFTSGTTGRAKGVPIRHRHALATADALADAWKIGPAHRVIHILPLFHIHGLIVALHGALRAGAAVDLRDPSAPGFDLAADVEAAVRAGGNTLMAVPTHWQRLAAHPGGLAPLRGLRLATSGSAPLPSALHRAVEAAAGVRIVERYGLTEAGIVVSNLPDTPRPGAIGWPLPGVAVRVVDPASAELRDVAVGDVGELLVSAPSVVDGFLHHPEATAGAFLDLPDGRWLRTGDLGRRDEDGCLWLVGRRADLVLVGGFNVYPAEIEAVLRDHPDVEDVAVVGRPDGDLGERPVAFFVARAAVEAEALDRWCRARLSAYKVPAAFHAVDALPRNATGKVARTTLRARAEELS
jgi:malonyl-CoA/methylmalonyl-CoA synthetase